MEIFIGIIPIFDNSLFFKCMWCIYPSELSILLVGIVSPYGPL